MSKGWYYWTWPFAALDATDRVASISWPFSKLSLPRETVRRVWLCRWWPLRGIRFEREDGSRSPAFLAFRPGAVLANLAALGWPVDTV
jgi:hypothetical protein